MEDNRFVSRLHHPSLLATARKSIMNVHHHHHHHLVVVPSSAEEVLGRPGSAAGSSNKMGGIVPVVPEEQKAKARDQQKKWRENLKKDTAKSSEYREMQRERTRMWKEKMRINDAERFHEISRKHQAQCKKWWEKLTPEQRREKRKQYNLKWRQNQKKNLLGDASDSSDSKEGDWQQQQQLPASSSSSYGRANEQLLKIPTAPGALLASSASSSAEYYGKGGNNGNGVPTGPVFNVVSGSVVYPFSYFPFRCQVQQSGTARGNSA